MTSRPSTEAQFQDENRSGCAQQGNNADLLRQQRTSDPQQSSRAIFVRFDRAAQSSPMLRLGRAESGACAPTRPHPPSREFQRRHCNKWRRRQRDACNWRARKRSFRQGKFASLPISCPSPGGPAARKRSSTIPPPAERDVLREPTLGRDRARRKQQRNRDTEERAQVFHSHVLTQDFHRVIPSAAEG